MGNGFLLVKQVKYRFSFNIQCLVLSHCTEGAELLRANKKRAVSLDRARTPRRTVPRTRTSYLFTLCRHIRVNEWRENVYS